MSKKFVSPQDAAINPSSDEGSAENAPVYSDRLEYLHDPISKKRDHLGDSIAKSFAYSIPTIEDTPFDKSAYVGLIKEIGKHNQGEADDLRAKYEKVLVMARRAKAVYQAKIEASEKRSKWASSQNQQIRSEITTLTEAHDKDIAKEEANLNDLEKLKAKAHHEAGHHAALCGVVYDPSNPDPKCVLVNTKESEKSLAIQLGIPFTSEVKNTLWSKIGLGFMTAVTGTSLGLSLTLMNDPSVLDLLTRKWPTVAYYTVFGVIAAIMMAMALKTSFRMFAEKRYAGLPFRQWASYLALAVFTALTCIVVDTYIQMHGLMAKAALQNALLSLGHKESSSGGNFLYFLAGTMMSFPYVGANSWLGYLEGRHIACSNRIIGEQERRFEENEKTIRKDEAVQTTLSYINRVHNLLQQEDTAKKRMDVSNKIFQEELEKLEGSLQDDAVTLNAEELQSIEEAIHNFQGAQHEFDEQVARAKRNWTIPETVQVATV